MSSIRPSGESGEALLNKNAVALEYAVDSLPVASCLANQVEWHCYGAVASD